MKLDLFTILTILGAVNMKLQDVLKDKSVTVKEVMELLETVIDSLGIGDKVIFHKD